MPIVIKMCKNRDRRRQILNKNILTIIILALFFFSLPQMSTAAEEGNLRNKAEEAYYDGNYEDAAIYYQKLLRMAPANLRARMRYGKILYKLGKHIESLEQFTLLRSNSNENITTHEYLARNYLKTDNHDKARKSLRIILRNFPEHEYARKLLIDLDVSADTPAKDIIAAPGRQKEPSTTIEKEKIEKEGVKEEKVEKEKVEKVFVKEKVVNNNKVSPDILMAPAKKYTITKKDWPIESQNHLMGWDIADFLELTRSSFLVNYKYARFALEAGDITRATISLRRAIENARSQRNTTDFIEAQKLKCLIHVYNLDFNAFGKHLFRLQPAINRNTYQSFLNIYNNGESLKCELQKARLAAGVAMGAGHYKIASNLFSKVHFANPGDTLIANLLAESQVQSMNYRDAQKTLKTLAKAQNSSTAWIKLAKFHLTATYDPSKVKQYLKKASEIDSNDPGISLIQALKDYSTGNIDKGIKGIKNVLPKLESKEHRKLCEIIISKGFFSHKASEEYQKEFIELLALPGARHASKCSYRKLGNEFLSSGSVFSAMRYYLIAKEPAESGRAYLALSSALKDSNEHEAARISESFGLNALSEELSLNPYSSRANLYLTIYFRESGNIEKARQIAIRGLKDTQVTREKLQLEVLLKSMET